MALPQDSTPLYNHSLMAIEVWLQQQGCEQDESDLNCWHISQEDWSADLVLDVEQIVVSYDSSGNRTRRAFPYSLSRKDLEAVIFSGR